MSRRKPGAVVAALTIVLLGACSGEPASPPVSGPAPSPASAAPSATASGAAGDHAGTWDVSTMPDPCLTVDAAEVTRATGLSVGKGVPVDSWPPLCSFTLKGPAQEYLYVSADPRPEARADYDRQRSDSQATRAVDGVGDEAYWLPEFTALHVFSGTTHLTVKFAGSKHPADPQGKAVALARAALG